ncbi:hypothetical protein FRC17_005732 [Serendipita sp. 399]|nr:hypothetical protein FRC17_005732 [Serendipita sp. 399]
MGWFSHDSDEAQAHDQITNGRVHKAAISHELIAAAASYVGAQIGTCFLADIVPLPQEAAKAYERHVAENGKPASHAEAKEIMAGIVGAFVDREVETKGLDFIDTERAKREARQRANAALADSGDY